MDTVALYALALFCKHLYILFKCNDTFDMYLTGGQGGSSSSQQGEPCGVICSPPLILIY